VIQRANDAIIETVNRDYAPFDREPSEVMGSTCVLALIHRGVCHLASIGDSRAYLFRDGAIERITRDHNLRTLGVAQGLDPDVAATFPHGDALARCLGAGELDGESLVPSTVEPDVYVFAMQPGDRLLLCTDGVTDFLAPEEQELEDVLAQVLASGAIPEHVCLDLIYLANHAGGADNIGCSVAFAGPAFTDALEWYFAESGDSEVALEELEHIEEIDPD
jgi:protein phosphatase